MRGAQGELRDLAQVRRHPRVFAFLSAPVDTRLCSLTIPTPPLAHSLERNNIRAEGASALAAIFKETQITELKCAAARVFAFVSIPTDTFANPSTLPCTFLLASISERK